MSTTERVVHGYDPSADLDTVWHFWPCGCYAMEGYRLGNLDELRVRACTACFNEALDRLEQLTIDIRSQLTLDIASSASGPESSNERSDEKGHKDVHRTYPLFSDSQEGQLQ